MIPVNVLSSRLMLVVSVGPRPANSRPANSTREYEPGSGESHDPAPVHHPHPARSPPAVVSGGLGARREPTGAPLQPQGCCASLTRPALGRPLTPEPLRPLAQQQRGRPTTCPGQHRRAPRPPNTTASPGQARDHPSPRGRPQYTHAQNRANQAGKTTTLDHKPVDQRPAGLTSRFI
jgi:hypothetical protein